MSSSCINRYHRTVGSTKINRGSVGGGGGGGGGGSCDGQVFRPGGGLKEFVLGF